MDDPWEIEKRFDKLERAVAELADRICPCKPEAPGHKCLTGGYSESASDEL